MDKAKLRTLRTEVHRRAQNLLRWISGLKRKAIEGDKLKFGQWPEGSVRYMYMFLVCMFTLINFFLLRAHIGSTTNFSVWANSDNALKIFILKDPFSTSNDWKRVVNGARSNLHHLTSEIRGRSVDLEVWSLPKGSWPPTWEYGQLIIQEDGGWFDFLLKGWSPSSPNSAPEEKALILSDQAKVTYDMLKFWIEMPNLSTSQPDVVGLSLEPGKVYSTADGNTKEWSEDQRKDLSVFYLYRLLTTSNAFVPASQEVWSSFRRWLAGHESELFLWPKINKPKSKLDDMWQRFSGTPEQLLRLDSPGLYQVLKKTRIPPYLSGVGTEVGHWSLWLSRFAVENRMFFVYPASTAAMTTPQGLEFIQQEDMSAFVRVDVRGKKVSSPLPDVKKLLARVGDQNPVVVVEANDKEKIESWFCSLNAQRLELPGPTILLTTSSEALAGVQDRGVVVSSYKTESSRAEFLRSILILGRPVLYLAGKVVWPSNFLSSVDALHKAGAEVIAPVREGHLAETFCYLAPTLSVQWYWKKVVESIQERETRKFEGNTMISSLDAVLLSRNISSKNPVLFASIPSTYSLVSAEIGCIHMPIPPPKTIQLYELNTVSETIQFWKQLYGPGLSQTSVSVEEPMRISAPENSNTGSSDQQTDSQKTEDSGSKSGSSGGGKVFKKKVKFKIKKKVH